MISHNNGRSRKTTGASPLRHRDQSMGLWLNESLIKNHSALEEAVRDLATAGYGIIRVMLRNTNFHHRSASVVEAVRKLVSCAHDCGVRVALDCEPHPQPVAMDLGHLYPAAIGFRIARGECRLVDGRFAMRIPAPNPDGTRADFQGVEAAFLQADGVMEKLEECSYSHRVVVEPYDNGFTSSNHSYREGVQAFLRPTLHLSGRLPSAQEGSLIVYARFFDPRLIDFWSEGTWRYFDQLLESYADIPLDGISWDEPAMGGDWSHYIAGSAFLHAFAQRHGYELSGRWHLLDGPLTEEALAVRLHYYQTLNEGVFEAQRRLIAKARKLWGSRLLLGTHHTWQGEGGINDYRAGAVDYFRLNSQMDAGYTDCWWWDLKSCCYAYSLGSSLGRLTPTGEAEVNTWDAKPTNERVEFHARLMTLLDVSWFNIWYGRATDTCLYPADYTWPATQREMRAHRDAQRAIGAARPVIDVAILHGWETVCALNRADVAAAHKAFCLNVAELGIFRSVAFDWIDGGLLEASRVERRQLQNALGRYSVLVLPYASVLPPGAWEVVRQFAEAGGRIIFIGPPPHRDTEGHSLEESFANLLDMDPLPLESYLAGIDAISRLPADRPDKLDVCLQLDGDPSRLLYSPEGEAHGIRNAAENVIYLTDLDPRFRLAGILERWTTPEVTAYSDSLLWRLYREPDRSLLICVAREGLALRGLVRFADYEVEFFGGTIALLELRHGILSIAGPSVAYQMLRRPTEAASEQTKLSHTVS